MQPTLAACDTQIFLNNTKQVLHRRAISTITKHLFSQTVNKISRRLTG